MTPLLLDTSGLLCLLHRAELEHNAAVSHFNSTAAKLTHSYVLAEFVALSQARHLPRPAVLAFLADLEASSEVAVVYVGERLHHAGMRLLHERLDKSWSLCDAVSFVIMQESHVMEALTTDRHFEQAGFRRLLGPEA